MRQLIFIRHGEKTKEDAVHLSDRGVVRSHELVAFFAGRANPSIDKPDIVIAMRQYHRQSSDRPRETVVPLADAMNLRVMTPYTREEVHEVVELLLQLSTIVKTILVCWEHARIADIMSLLLKRRNGRHCDLTWGADPTDGDYDGGDYGSIWVLDDRSFRVFKQLERPPTSSSLHASPPYDASPVFRLDLGMI